MRVDGEGCGVHAAEHKVHVQQREDELDHLAATAAAGDRTALERLLTLIQPSIVRYCRARMGPGIGLATPEDVSQDVLLAVCGALPRFRPHDTHAMAFVYGIARNKVVDAFRAAGRDRSEPTESIPDSADQGPGPEMKAVLTTEIGELRELLGRLSTTQAEVLVLRIALQFSAEETARIMDSTPGTVRVTQHRAMMRLRAMVAERI